MHSSTHKHIYTPCCCPKLCGWYPTPDGSGSICLWAKDWGGRSGAHLGVGWTESGGCLGAKDWGGGRGAHLGGGSTESGGRESVNTPAGKTCASSTHSIPTHEYTTHIHHCNLCMYCQIQTHGRLDLSCVAILDCSGGTNAKVEIFPSVCRWQINCERCRFSVGQKTMQGMHCACGAIRRHALCSGSLFMTPAIVSAPLQTCNRAERCRKRRASH